jgi:hypothetical protein
MKRALVLLVFACGSTQPAGPGEPCGATRGCATGLTCTRRGTCSSLTGTDPGSTGGSGGGSGGSAPGQIDDRCTTHADCAAGLLCNAGECRPDQPGEFCRVGTDDCGSKWLCYRDVCRDIGHPCASDSDCHQYCLEGECTMSCTVGSGDDCPPGWICREPGTLTTFGGGRCHRN